MEDGINLFYFLYNNFNVKNRGKYDCNSWVDNIFD